MTSSAFLCPKIFQNAFNEQTYHLGKHCRNRLFICFSAQSSYEKLDVVRFAPWLALSSASSASFASFGISAYRVSCQLASAKICAKAVWIFSEMFRVHPWRFFLPATQSSAYVMLSFSIYSVAQTARRIAPSPVEASFFLTLLLLRPLLRRAASLRCRSSFGPFCCIDTIEDFKCICRVVRAVLTKCDRGSALTHVLSLLQDSTYVRCFDSRGASRTSCQFFRCAHSILVS